MPEAIGQPKLLVWHGGHDDDDDYYYYYYKICIVHKFKHARVGGTNGDVDVFTVTGSYLRVVP